jgi:hypothetical protein
MIAKVQPARQRSGSFKRLLKYLTEERDADTGEPLLRGEVVLSDNIAGLDTVAIQMEGIAFLNPRCKDLFVIMNCPGHQVNVRLGLNGKIARCTH